MLSALLVSGLLFLLLLFLVRGTYKPEHFPPGPPRIPLVGSLLCMHMRGSGSSPSLLHSFQDAAHAYGNLVGFYLGSFPALLVSDFQALKELFKLEELSARPPIRPNNEWRPGWKLPELDGRNPGIILCHGRYWREQRRFALRHLRDFGFGKTSMEDLLSEEVQKLVQVFRLHQNQPLNLNRTMNVSILNALWSIVVGERFELDDPKLATVIHMIDNMLKNGSPISAVTAMLPHWSMAKWPILDKLSGFYYGKQTFDEIVKLLSPYIEEHKRTIDPDNPRDFTDVMLLEIQNSQDPTSSFYGKTGENAIMNVIIDLFLAGQETTSASLVWIFFYLTHHPEVQAHLHKELDEVVGQDRLPRLEDKEKLPYLSAVILESFRASSVIFGGVPHYATKPIKLPGGCYQIPEGTYVFANLYGIMHDPSHFSEPEIFNPERFIRRDHSTGKMTFQPHERVIPFSVGKRSCLGQSLAEKEFFLFFAGLVQNFTFHPAKDAILPDYSIKATHPKGPNRPAPQYQITLKARF
uniref:Cytochrome P450 3075C1 n=1 Tax=Paracyclopina nana TaxID=565004 RepID=A0A0F7IZX8_PARNA|nr:cytochrome P450 3075C1 [Paracyclopina nana]